MTDELTEEAIEELTPDHQPSVRQACEQGEVFACPNCDYPLTVDQRFDLDNVAHITLECGECPWQQTFDPDQFDREIPENVYDYDVLTDISGVGEWKAQKLIDAGFRSVEDVRRASQQELGSVDGIGMELAAHIKADVGDVNNVATTEVATDGTCPVENCIADVDEANLYEHMIAEHGWWSPELEVDDNVG